MIWLSRLDVAKRPHIEVMDEFKRKAQDKYHIKMFINLNKSKIATRQRHLYITPTYFHFSPAYMLETNKVLRKYSEYENEFLRVSFYSDRLDKDYYNGNKNKYKLGYIHRIMTKGINIEQSMKNFKFLCYSNS